jgi:hypothetical protein
MTGDDTLTLLLRNLAICIWTGGVARNWGRRKRKFIMACLFR